MCRQLERAYYLNKYFGRKLRIFSNYPVGFWKTPIGETRSVYFQPEPLNMEALYVFDKELFDCQVYIDEIDQWMDRQEWAAVTQKLINKVTQLIRKRKMSMHGTIQSFEWLNSRLQFQTDIIVRCREAAFSPWGKMNGLRLGEMAFLTWYDNSGIMTGYTYKENPKTSIKEDMFREGHRFWNSYDTSFEFDPLSTSTKYRLKLPVKEIVVGGAAPVGREINGNPYREKEGKDSGGYGGGGSPETSYIKAPLLSGDRKNAWNSRMSHVVEQLLSEGKKTVTGPELWDLTEGTLGNGTLNKSDAGSALKRLGVTRGGHGGEVYNLSTYTGQFVRPQDGQIVRDAEDLIRNAHDVAVAV
jgi:hypothetical protein